jgi:hypothetical protein
VNHDNTYKQTEGRNQLMQLDLSKVLSRSTLTSTPKVGGWNRKSFVFDCVYVTSNGFMIFIAQKSSHMS